jgi:glycerol-1-phosphate dehydrogenase [NAD(P)+]
MNIERRDGKLILTDLSCGCEYSHTMPQMDIHIRDGLLGGCAECVSDAGLGKNALIVCDANTYEVAAAAVQKNLAAAGMSARLCMLPGEHIEPTPQMADLICGQAEGADFLLSVGSGVITDLTRRSAYLTGKPFAVFGTAASMDGYTSITSSMMIGGTKVSQYGNAARLLMFDPEVLATAPPAMQAAGVGDVLAKYNALVDWKLGHAVAGEIYCPLCEQLLLMALTRCSSGVKEIAKRTPRGCEALIESLIFAGLTVLIVGSTRPVASGEHNMSHYWEMSQLAYGGSCPSHGVSVGIGLIYSLLMHEYLRAADLTAVDYAKIKAARLTRSQRRQWFMDIYPPGAGEDVLKMNTDWYLGWPEQRRRVGALQAYHAQYQKDCALLPDYREVREIMELFGVPTSAKKAGIDASRLEKTLLCAGDFRKRYSVAEALRELDMLRGCVDRILEMEDTL